jgi:hypothetical protein
VVVEHGGDNILQSVYVALVVPVNPVAGVYVYCPVEAFTVSVPEPGFKAPAVNTGVNAGLVPLSLVAKDPLIVVLIMVAEKSAVAEGVFPTRIKMVVFVHTAGDTEVLQIV